MNIIEYISSGILEQYVSGTASDQERQEVECMSHIYPEIKSELLSMQNALEAFAIEEAITPPSHLKTNIFNALKSLKEEEEITLNKTTPTNNNVESEVEAIHKPAGNIVAMPSNYLKIAASLLLLISGGLAFLLVNKNNKNVELSNSLTKIENELNINKIALNTKTELINIIQNKDFQQINMTGIPAKSPNSLASIYWNKNTSEVYVSVKNLPQPIDNKQYQLWAIADGKPVDLGMIDGVDINSIFQKMKTIKNPSAFAVTLEKKGGVPSPTMSEMYVMGGV